MAATIETFIPQIRKRLETLKDEDGAWLYGNRSHLKHVLTRLNTSSDNLELAARRAIEIVIDGIRKEIGAGYICLNIGKSLGYISGYSPNDPPKVTDAGICAMGLSILDWFAQDELIATKKLVISKKKSVWMIVPQGDFVDLIVTHTILSHKPAINAGPVVWKEPILMVNNNPLELVKGSINAKLVHNYTEKNIPLVYEAINRCNRREWRVNQHMLSLMLSMPDDCPFIPEPITEEEMEYARKSITQGEWRLEGYRKFLMKEVLNNSGYNDEDKKRFATTIAKKRQKEEKINNNNILSIWSKQEDFNKILDIAMEYQDDVLNFCYFLDSRGRMYPMQHYLNPIGNDQAKSLLKYNSPQSINLTHLAITTANLMGQDKLPFKERVEYTYDNMEMIIRLGINPWSYPEDLIALDLSKKDKWQFLAIANVWAEYSEWVADGNEPDVFVSSIPNARDGSNQGLQILSLIGRDEFAAPMVNVAPTYDPQGNQIVGDAYAYIATFLPAALSAIDDPGETLTAFTKAITADPKKARKVCKRNTMTKSYAGTRYGFGRQHIEDKDSYEFPEASALTWKDCNILGGVIYDLIEEHFSKPSELMQWMIDGIDCLPSTHSHILTWTLPDGFVAFANKSQKREMSVRGFIGRQKVVLSMSLTNDIAHKTKHKFAIAPNVVHSLDAYLLRDIVRTMPPSVPFSTIHDSFNTTSNHVDTLIPIAREAYLKATDRDMFKQMMSRCFKKERELPLAGTLDCSSMHQTNYFIS